jgi:hypothetical protein
MNALFCRVATSISVSKLRTPVYCLSLHFCIDFENARVLFETRHFRIDFENARVLFETRLTVLTFENVSALFVTPTDQERWTRAHRPVIRCRAGIPFVPT